MPKTRTQRLGPNVEATTLVEEKEINKSNIDKQTSKQINSKLNV